MFHKSLFIAGAIIVSIAVSTCSSYTPYDQHLRGDFDPNNIDSVENIVRTFANIHKLVILAKDREHMTVLSSGTPAFLLFLLIPGDDDAFISVGNVGPGELIDLTLIDTEYSDLAETRPIFEKLVNILSSSGLVGKLEVVPNNGT